jgi:hypothetical protein
MEFFLVIIKIGKRGLFDFVGNASRVLRWGGEGKLHKTWLSVRRGG